MLINKVFINYSHNHIIVHYAMIDLSKPYAEININILIEKLKFSGLSFIFVEMIRYLKKNTYVNIKYNNCIGND